MAENDKEIVIEDADIQEDDFSEDELKDETIDWKAKAVELKGIAKRRATKLNKLKSAPKPAPAAEPAGKKEEKKGFDYAEKAFLKTSGIQSDEFDFVKEVMDSTGKSLDDVIETKWFQNELKERRDAKASKEAVPAGSKRSSTSAKDNVDYWIAKGELPPADQRELRQKVVNARIKSEGNKEVFTPRSVVGG